jgi:hypothetical protein
LVPKAAKSVCDIPTNAKERPRKWALTVKSHACIEIILLLRNNEVVHNRKFS